MHHFRGTLLKGDLIRLNPANVYIEYDHDTASGPEESWQGYLLVASEADVAPGGTYTLTLVDGRAGKIRIGDLAPDDSGKYRANFVGDGPLG